MRAFSVSSRDLFDLSKNPTLSLSPREIIRNKKINKEVLGSNKNVKGSNKKK